MKPVITDALEKCFTNRKYRDIVLSISNSAIASCYLLLSRYFHEWHELFVKIHFNAEAY